MALSRIVRTHRNPYDGRFRVVGYPENGGGERLYPITLAQLKAQLSLPSADVSQDNLLNQIIAAATESAQKYMGRWLLTHEVEYTLDMGSSRRNLSHVGGGGGVRHGSIRELLPIQTAELRGMPFQSMTEIVSAKDDGTETIEDPDHYFVDDLDPNLWARVEFGISAFSSISCMRDLNSVTMRYRVGYADAAPSNDIPDALTQGLLMWSAWLYENRGDCSSGSAGMAPAAKAMLDPYRTKKV